MRYHLCIFKSHVFTIIFHFFTFSTRVMNIQNDMSERAIELLQLPADQVQFDCKNGNL